MKLRVQLRKTGIRPENVDYYLYNVDNPVRVKCVPYKPFEVEATYLKTREDDSIDVVLSDAVYLSNGNGPANGGIFYNLAPNGNARYYPRLTECDRISPSFLVNHHELLQDYCEWDYNVPRWKLLCYKESRATSLEFLMCTKKIRDISQGYPSNDWENDLQLIR